MAGYIGAQQSQTLLDIEDGSVTSADLASTLDLSGKTVTLPAGTGGKVLQVVQGTSTTSTTTSSTSYVTANLSANITPSSVSNKILVLLNGVYDTDASGRQIYFALYRDASNISGGANTAFDGPYNGGARQIGITTLNHLDSPSTTSSVTYTLYFKSQTGSSVEFCSQSTEARIILMEIAG